MAKDFIGEITLRVGTFGLKHFRENWRKGGYYEGSSFKQWQPRKYSYDHPILLDTQRSYNSLTSYISSGKITFRVSTPYIGYHQTGAEPQNAARPVLYDSPEIDKAVVDAANDVFFQWFNKGGGKAPNRQR